MAYNWGQGATGALSGAASGASMGSMFGPLGTGIGAGIGGLLGAFGGFGQDASTQQLNPYTDQYWNLMQGNMENYNRQMGSAMGTQAGFLGGAQDFYRQLAGFQPTASFDPAAATRMTMGQLPQIEQMAQRSLGSYSDPEALRRNIQSAATGAASQFNQMNALGSGAAAGAIGQAAGGVAANAALQQQGLYQNAYMNMLAQQQGLNQAGVQGQYGAQAAADQMRFQGLAGAAGGYGDIAGQYGQRAGMFGNLLGQTQAGMASMAGAEYLHTPAQAGPDIGGSLMGIAALDSAMRGPYGEGAGLFGNLFTGGGRQATPVMPQGQPAPRAADMWAVEQSRYANPVAYADPMLAYNPQLQMIPRFTY